MTYNASGEGHYDGLVPMEPIPGARRPQRFRRRVQRLGQVDEERTMLANILQELPAGEQIQGELLKDLMGTIRSRVAELRRVMEGSSSAHLASVKSLEERMRGTGVVMPLENIRDELSRALQTMTECGQLAMVQPRTFCASSCRGYAPLACCNQMHPVLRQMGGRKCVATEDGATLRDLPQNCDGGPWAVEGDEDVGRYLVVTRDIQQGEIITGFGSTAITSTTSEEGHELETLQKHAWQSDSGKQFQYTYRARYSENEGVWIVPPPDIDFILSQCHPSAALRQGLSRRSTLGGGGFLAEHSCCGIHRNSKIELILQHATVEGGTFVVERR